MSNISLARLLEGSMVAHSKPQYAYKVWFVEVAEPGQFREGDFSVQRDFARNIELVNSMKAGSIILVKKQLASGTTSIAKVT